MARPLLFAVIAFCVSPTAGVPAAEPASEDASPVRVLVLHGGHGFDQPRFFALFDAMPGVTYDRLDLKADAAPLQPSVADRYDVLVQYDMIGGLKPEQHDAYQKLLEKGIGVVALHHTIGARSDWPEYRKVLGGTWVWKPQEIDGESYPKSTFKHGVTIPVKVADPDHPITEGLDDFEIVDERYGGLYVSPDVHVLLRTDAEQCNPELAWTHRYANSPVFYLMLGHDNRAWSHPAYGKLVERAIHWAAGKSEE